MADFEKKSPYMDYRNTVPFMNLSGYIVRRPTIFDDAPAKSLNEYLLRKKFSTMINLRRLQYRCLVEEYRNGRK